MVLPISIILSQLMSNMRAVEQRHQELRSAAITRRSNPSNSVSESHYQDAQYDVRVKRSMQGTSDQYLINTTITLTHKNTKPSTSLQAESRLVKSRSGNSIEIDWFDVESKTAKPISIEDLKNMVNSEDPAISLVASKLLGSITANFGSEDAINRLPVILTRKPALRVIELAVNDEEPYIDYDCIRDEQNRHKLSLKTTKREIHIDAEDKNMVSLHDKQNQQFLVIKRVTKDSDDQPFIVLSVEHEEKNNLNTRLAVKKATIYVGDAEDITNVIAQKAKRIDPNKETQQTLSEWLGQPYLDKVAPPVEVISL